MEAKIIKKVTVCFSGHREIPLEERESLIQRLENEVNKLINRGFYIFVTGGALGFDTIAAQVVLSSKIKHPHIRLILALPCRTQTKYWCDDDVKIYNDIICQSDQVIYASEAYNRGCMFKRNRLMVDLSSVCICYQREKTGGTAYTVKYASNQGVNIINIAEK